ncbi:MAG: hypothetical protein ACOCXD_01700, partial [Bacteroidota bacterium]
MPKKEVDALNWRGDVAEYLMYGGLTGFNCCHPDDEKMITQTFWCKTDGTYGHLKKIRKFYLNRSEIYRSELRLENYCSVRCIKR